MEDLIPTNKFDKTGIERLKTIEPEEAVPILERLTEWIRDLNWPVAQELMKVLPRFHRQLVPIIRNIFASHDDIWKYWTMELLKAFRKKR